MASPEIVRVEYVDNPELPALEKDYTRFVCISDTHSHTFDVPGGSDDILLHSGDLTNLGTLNEFATIIRWLSALPHRYKIIIAGNHDLALHESWYSTNYHRFPRQGPEPIDEIKELLLGDEAKQSGLIYLQDDHFSFPSKDESKTWNVYGSPWSPWFHNWAFNYPRSTGASLVGNFPMTDILLTHGPPANIFDKTISHELVGCQNLAQRMPTLRPRLSVFGHIHEDHGAAIHSWEQGAPLPTFHSPGMTSIDALRDSPNILTLRSEVDERDHTVFVNAANSPTGPAARIPSYTRFGGPRFRPIIVDLKNNP